jgi:hypothetical protein
MESHLGGGTRWVRDHIFFYKLFLLFTFTAFRRGKPPPYDFRWIEYLFDLRYNYIYESE